MGADMSDRRPELMAVRGGWMARSAVSSRVHIAVIAPSQDEAIAAFERESEAWAQLLDAHDRATLVAA